MVIWEFPKITGPYINPNIDANHAVVFFWQRPYSSGPKLSPSLQTSVAPATFVAALCRVLRSVN